MGDIFIQVAAYRDPELAKTLRDAVEKARFPENLVFGLCWQYHPADPFTPEQEETIVGINRIKVVPVDLSKTISNGACWARHQLQQLYDGEPYTFQIDSHMRFIPNWDEAIINMYLGLQADGYNKPLITSYVPSYEPATDPEGRLNEVWRMDFDRFCPEGWLATAPSLIPDWQSLEKPVPARFYSAHFAFTTGDFVAEVPHDPQFYFHGEEPSIAVRAYTWGYDLFHPHRIICWHEYTRNNKRKQWDDDPAWVAKNNISHLRYRQMFGMDNEPIIDLHPYGLGKSRTLADYKRYSGVDMTNRAIQAFTKERNNPPNPVIEDPQEYEASFFNFFRHCLDINALDFQEPDYDVWAVAFEKRDGTVLHRADASKEEIRSLMEASKKDDNWIRLWREYYGEVPEIAVVWAHSESKGWLNRVEISIK